MNRVAIVSVVLAVGISACAVIPGQGVISPNWLERVADGAINVLDRFSSNPGQVGQPVPASQAQQITVSSDMDQLLADLYDQANPSVVNIQVRKLVAVQQPQFPFVLPFQMPSVPQQGYSYAEGSGFVFDSQGHIVTNDHVVDGADQVTVFFTDGTAQEAQVIGTDPDSDLAVVQVDRLPIGVKQLPLAVSENLRVGQQVIAIGNPFGLQGTMTTGIVSALGRTLASQAASSGGQAFTIPDVIQTDAAINPGNSGGPLLNLSGQVVGVNSAIESQTGQFNGVGFAVPSDTVAQVVPVLIASGSFNHPYLGIAGTDLTPDLRDAMGLDPSQRGALVVDVVAGSPAARARLRASNQQTQIAGQTVRTGGDVIVSIDGQPILDFEDLLSYISTETQVGQQVSLGVLRDGKPVQLSVTLAERPSG
jgi:2-alkenal reductase